MQQAARSQNPTSRLPSDLAAAEGDGAGGKRQRGKGIEGTEGGASDAGAKPKVKRDKYAGMPRKRRRMLQRNEILEAEAKEGNISLPNQKALARGAKAAAKSGKLRQQAAVGSGGTKAAGTPQGEPLLLLPQWSGPSDAFVARACVVDLDEREWSHLS